MIHQVGYFVEDDANVEAVAVSLKAKIVILIKSLVDPKSAYNIKIVSSNSSFNRMPNSAFKSTSANVRFTTSWIKIFFAYTVR